MNMSTAVAPTAEAADTGEVDSRERTTGADSSSATGAAGGEPIQRSKKNGRPGAAQQPDVLVSSESVEFVETLFEDYQRDPQSVTPGWRKYFEELTAADPALAQRADGFKSSGRAAGATSAAGPRITPTPQELHSAILQERVDQLVRNFRVRGHMVAQIDPLGRPRPQPPELDPKHYGFTDADLNRTFSTTSLRGPDVATLGEILERLRTTYCRSIGVQFMHIDSLAVREWLQNRMEGTENRVTLDRRTQLRILHRLTAAVVFEEFIQKKYIGAKSFSLEGAESLIPLLDLTIEKAGEDGVEEIVMAMAHRGRLNVLANIVGKDPHRIFREFDDADHELHMGRGDVKYHLGYSNDWKTSSGKNVHISLCFNPSHLEYVNPVALGRMRAKQDRIGDRAHVKGMVLLIHGDAAFAGEGVVQETLNLSELNPYSTGGTVHIIVNNQLGFTTGPEQGRSSTYSTDVAKMLQSPIFHVNGEHPEAVAQVMRLAMDFRREFRRDVIIDMYCYRLRGHNESDEPSFTQPLMYRAIEKRKSVRASYVDHLVQLGGITREEAEHIVEQTRERLEKELATARSDEYKPRVLDFGGLWRRYVGGPESDVPDVETGAAPERLAQLLEAQTHFPEDFTPHPKIVMGLKRRKAMAAGEAPLDWSAAESLAFASLAADGYRVRMTGQDVERGTFSQRHAVLHDVKNGKTYVPLQHVAEDQGPVEIWNSSLSEAGVLGFEYGYSLDWPDGLVLWEAQFGDFVNAAQVIVDQFIASAEDKWRRLSGLVMLLPHGFEGQGPEHSSARLERFLLMSAEDNLQVTYPTTPAQYFHLLRRQVLRPWRKPLIVMTPKSLLRH